MKALLTILLLLPSYLFAQDITGIWTGTLSTSEKKIPYEVVISDSSGILIGYSHISFIVKGKEITAVKILSVNNDGDKVTLEDERLIADNFPDAGPKRIMQIASLVLNTEGPMMELVGTFKTKKVNELKPINGYISLQKKKNTDSSRLMTSLNNLDLTSSLSFLQLKKQTGKVVIDTTVRQDAVNHYLASRRALPVAPPVASIPKPVVVVPKDTQVVAVKEVSKPVIKTVAAALPKVVKPTAIVAEQKPKEIKTTVVAVPKVVKAAPVAKPIAKPAVAVKQPISNQPVVVKPPVQKPVVVAAPVRVNKFDVSSGAAADIAHRQIQNIQTLYINSDSIVVTLYDNGEVDGDTVSILLNGKIIMPKVGLSTNPVTKTVYVTPDLGDSLQFVMYAENLGSIPPNTGLMILQDGKTRHEIFFSGDLEKNAAITLRRRHD